MKITRRLTTLNKIVAAIASVNPTPIIWAEKTFIASPTPRFPGVIAKRIASEPIEAINNALKNPISIPNTLYIIKKFNAPKINCKSAIKEVTKMA